ncbi:carbohydrate-binding protein [Nonomuraea turkmeniaca]|uniref:Pectate lyase n=1 Tax=Nonomuraea turkmeniaca TaxID=103838 RepID=A0A5S4EX10_9ACTN|nr:pectate lyase [Nonomuraea turkmeniaca]TMR08202.1 carbohydrate-binding protein [Nonomuraea turkmeniaca]
MRLKAVLACAGLLAGVLVALSPSSAQAAPTRYEAESSPAVCTGTIDSNWAGYTASGFCNGNNASGAYAQFTVNASAAGTATLGIRFANGTTTARPAGLIVNGSTVQTPSFEGTGAWSTWVTKTLTVSVNAGGNTIRLNPTTANGLPNVDHLDFEVGSQPPPTSWPTPTGQVSVNGTIQVPASGLDGGMRRYCCIGDGGQEEDQDPMFSLASGATLSNVIIGAPAGDGVHCSGPCTLRNVWWEDVGEDAATFRGSGSPSFLVDGGGARAASDKVFQHNGPGTLTVQNFQANNFGTFYRSCGNCSSQYQRNVVIRNVTLTRPGNTVAGINTNYGDTARFTGITIVNDPSRAMVICRKYRGNNTGDEPTQVGTGADGTNCIYSSSDITYR